MALIAVVLVLVTGSVVGWIFYRRAMGFDRADRETPEQIRQQIIALDSERLQLRERLEALMVRDVRLDGMPDLPVRVAVPTALARDLVERVIAGAVDQITLDLRGFRVRRQGSVRRVVTLGDYDLRVSIDRVTARLKTGTPRLTFGGNRVAIALPLTVASGTVRAALDFLWDGRTVGGAVCGDMHITQPVTGTVIPRTYPVSGELHLESTATEILVRPRLPRLRIHVDVMPSTESWTAAQGVLDEKRGLCGFVLDRVDVMGAVERLIERGFDVRIPTERVRSLALPVGIEPTMVVRGEPVALGIRVGGLTITEHAIWLGAHVSVARADGPAAPPGGAAPSAPVVRLLDRPSGPK